MSKKAVIATGGKQYLVSEGEKINVELIKADKKTLSFEPLLIIDDKKSTIGKPYISGLKVSASIIEQEVNQDKVTSIRYKAKKRVRKVRGHRQRLTTIKIDSFK
jgi:large subunit ribosomal protein L21